MKILVLIKQTFDTEEKITIQGGKIAEEGVKFIINPYDEYAIEEAIKIKEIAGGEVTVLTLGPTRAEAALRTALAMGADKGILIESDEENLDEYAMSKIIAAAIKDKAFDLIFAGNVAVDSGSGQVAIRIAEQLDIAHVATVTKFSIAGRKAIAERDVEGDTETVEVNLPVLVTAQQGLNEPRYPSLPGIMKANKKPLETIRVEDLGLSLDDLAGRTTVIEQYLPEKKKAGRLLQGEIRQQVTELANLLRTEAKVI